MALFVGGSPITPEQLATLKADLGIPEAEEITERYTSLIGTDDAIFLRSGVPGLVSADVMADTFGGGVSGQSITQSSRFNNSNAFYGGSVALGGGGGGALTVVNASTYNTTWATDHVITIPSVTSGNSLIIVSRSVRDDQRVTGSTLDATGVQEGQSGTFYTFRHIDNVTDGRTSVTITTYDGGSPASGGLHALVLEVNASAIAPASTQAGQETTSTTSFSHGFTTTAGGACAVAVVNAPGGPTLTGTGGWTAAFASGEWDKFLYTGDLGAAGAKTATGTISASGNVRTNTLAYAAV